MLCRFPVLVRRRPETVRYKLIILDHAIQPDSANGGILTPDDGARGSVSQDSSDLIYRLRESCYVPHVLRDVPFH